MWKRLGLVAVVGLLASQSSSAQSAKIEFLTRDGCANTERMRANLDEALRQLKRSRDYVVTDADTLSQADTKRGYGTPTVLVNGRDLFGMPQPEQQEHTPT